MNGTVRHLEFLSRSQPTEYLRRRMRRFLTESLAVRCVLGWPAHVLSARNREKRLSVCRFEICAILKRHNSIKHAERAMP